MYQAFNAGAVRIKVKDFEEMVQLASKAGFKGVYFSPGEVLKRGAEATKDLLDRNGLKAAGFGMPVEFRRDEDAFKKGLAELPKQAEAASRIGCGRCSTWLTPGSNELPYKENFEFHRKRLAEAAKILAVYKIRLGLEFVGPKTSRARSKHEFIYSAPQMLELCQAIGTGNCGLLLDCWHWYTSGGTPKDFETWTNATIVDVHVNDAPGGVAVDQQKDNVRALPGATGVIDIRGFLRGLQKIGYDGPVMAEPFVDTLSKMPPEEGVRATRESLGKIWKIAGIE
jgi:sugar phosphate isomerase/epimerase